MICRKTPSAKNQRTVKRGLKGGKHIYCITAQHLRLRIRVVVFSDLPHELIDVTQVSKCDLCWLTDLPPKTWEHFSSRQRLIVNYAELLCRKCYTTPISQDVLRKKLRRRIFTEGTIEQLTLA